MYKILVLLFLSTPVFAMRDFREAKVHLPQIHSDNLLTLYCGCKYVGKDVDLKSCGYKVHKNARRASRLEWEHVVPAEAFGRSFVEWREGHQKCTKKSKKYKGRKCARKNKEFAQMEADLYNLYPEIGELNGLRSNFSMTDFGENESLKGAKTFGACPAIVMNRKFEPMDSAKGIVARVYMYMADAYPNRGIISNKNEKLFEAWNTKYPVTDGECVRAKRILAVQGKANKILEEACLKKAGK
ncbi:MAG TPA: endonuclease [Bacteriovoracaceae bacterium]|nr:endonuclease [Bacteriovoracaceae bacterium]